MALKLFDRIGTLLKADAHGIVESLEERALLLKQYVREAEMELNRKRARLDAIRDEEKRLREALDRREEEVRSLDEDVALALASGKDDLARFAIRRLLPRRAEVKTLVAQIAECTAEAQGLGERVEVQQAQLDALRTRVHAELARGDEAPGASPWGYEPVVADEEVELELIRRREVPGGRP
ncbi:MAG: PspA/IM30 family protein [Candidatus Binatia bacterium]